MTLAKQKKDFTTGPILGAMFAFVLPIIATSMLQVLYNMADNIIVGQFSGDPDALAAVGSTSSLTNLILNIMTGLAAGSGVVVSHAFGAKDMDNLRKSVHTAMTLSVICGVAVSAIGLIIAKPMLTLMGTNVDLLEKAHLYMLICCLGIPATSVINFSATVLRSVGDSKTPLYILSISGILNVLLNLVFVIVFHMSIAGVALATIISQYASAVTLVYLMFRRKSEHYALSWREMRIDSRILARILGLGIPISIQSVVFSISNVIITVGVNTFDKTVISAKTIAGNIESLIYVVLNAFMQAALTFVGQNYGAKNPDRIKRSIWTAILQVLLIGGIAAAVMLVFAEPLTRLYLSADDPNVSAVLAHSIELLQLMLPAYVLCGVMETIVGALRGLGYSLAPMLITIIGTCGSRILWVFLIFPLPTFNSIVGLFLVYPVSWILTITAHSVTLIVSAKKGKLKKINTQNEVASA